MDRHDALTLAGLVLLTVGLWMVSAAAALIVLGIILMALGIYGAIS